MKKISNISKLTFIICVLSICICTYCNPKKKEIVDRKLKVVTTTGMIYDAVRNIGKDSVEVEALMGPGVDPHLYKATHGDLERLNDADIVFYNGLYLEGKMGDVLEKLNRIKPTVPIGEVIPKELLIKTNLHGGQYDPHIWFDVQLWMRTLSSIANELSNLDPENRAYYQFNLQSYLKDLQKLDMEIREKIGSIPLKQRILITAHDAFTYFGKAYQMEVRGLQGISTVSEFGLKDVNDLVKMIVERKISALFIESSVPPKSINAVIRGAQSKGHDVVLGGSLYSDAMGAFGTPEGTYTGMIRANVDKMVNALK